MPIQKRADLSPRELAPGYQARLIHGERITVSYVDIEAGSPLPEHRHPHEQIMSVLDGTYELTVDGTPHRMQAGDVLVIPSNVPHSGVAITDCLVLDVFAPVREDYR